MSEKTYDIIIIGAGLIGASLACALASSQYRICVIDKALPPAPSSIGKESRVNAYNLATEKLLRDIQVWEKLPQQNLFPFQNMFVCADTLDRSLTISAKELNQPHLGHFIENAIVQNALIQQVKSLPNIDLLIGKELKNFSIGDNSISISTQKNHTYHSKLLVGCDGIHSRVRQLANISHWQKSYLQSCIVGTIQLSKPHGSTAWQRFTTNGPLGILPLSPYHASLAWSCKQPYADYLLKLSHTDFLDQLTQNLHGEFGDIVDIQSRKSFPLSARHSNNYVAPRVALLGDAAHSIHPLAGLGANIGLQDVITLNELLRDAPSNQDIGQLAFLQRYQRKRKPHNSAIMQLMTTINNIYCSDHALLKLAQDFSINSAKLSLLKKVIANQTLWMDFFPKQTASKTNL